MRIRKVIIERHFGCIFLFCVFFSLPLHVVAVDETTVRKQDSLLSVLSQTHDQQIKIATLRYLANLFRQMPQEVAYLHQLLATAEKGHAIEDCYKAIFNLGRYYANENRLDSLMYFVHKLDSLAEVRKEIPESLFDLHNALCRYYLINSNFELAMNEAVTQKILAEKSNSKIGLIACNENFGLNYMITRRYREAISVFEECLSLLKELGNEPAYELQISECLARCYFFESEYDKAQILLEEFERTLVKIETSNDIKLKSYPKDKIRCILYSCRTLIYSSSGNLEKAEESAAALSFYKEICKVNYNSQSLYNLSMAHFFALKKEYSKALDCLNEMLQADYGTDGLTFKIKVLKDMGCKKEELAACKELLEFEKQLNVTAYISQVDQLRSLNVLKEQEKETQKILNQQAELDNQQLQMIALIVFTVILLIALFFLVRDIIHSWRLKNTLIEDEAILKATNHELTLATENAERAERMKSNFVANISHEIRTPLNAIVGFSELLKDSDEEERTEYIKVINNNSDLLLNLVSDVLDLSRLDGDNFTLNIQLTNIQECCQHALGTIRQRVVPGVSLTFTHPEKPFITKTDSLRLQQLLLSLLANAVKFTEKGEINLDYKVDIEEGKVYFTVTDTGCGIPLDKQKIIFNRFEKVDAFKQGAGLGLSICMAISNCFGGELYVDPAYTDGARFIFKLPIQH